ncbi:MAG: lipid-A-disaccharide synthase [Holophagales bacterium]|nr:lipid-A-disaccharide synthase [Holophagales bacterium]MBK9967818.1 lipid-A-disaccharide synthase [Holophagales bacterium]
MRLLLSAGEVSGDQHGAALLAALKERVPELEAFGLGGERCRAEGMRLLAHQKDLAIIGLVEALAKIRFARRLIHVLTKAATEARVDAAVLIDSPDFHLPLARRLAKAGIPVVFYVSPQVWAWRSGRAKKLARLGRGILTLFRFEKRWYDARGLGERVTWVGHPLVDEAARELASPVPAPPEGRRRIVLMPGSRAGEIRKLLPLLRDAAAILTARRSDLDVVLVKADSVPESLLREIAGDALSRWNVVSGPHLALLAASDVLVVASGTATVEGLLAGIPMVVVYRVAALSYFLGKILIKVPNVAMANILSDPGDGSQTVPELIQKAATPERIAAEVIRFLAEPARAAEARRRLALGREDLGPPGAPGRTAEAILDLVGRGQA